MCWFPSQKRREPWRQCQIAADDGQLRNSLVLEREVNAAICGVDDRSLCADNYRLADGAYFESDRHIQVLLGEQGDVPSDFEKPAASAVIL